MLLKLLFRNTFRHKLRTALTVCGMAVAILAFGMLQTVISAWYAGVEASAANRLVTRNAISLVFPLPLSYADKIRGVDGVETVSYGNWFGGIYIDEKHFFANFAVEPESFLELHPEFVLPESHKTAFLTDRKGCVAGRKLAERYGWDIGDTLTLRGTIFPGNWDFVLRGIYRARDETIDENRFFFHWAYLNETLKKVQPTRADQVGFYISGIERAEEAAGIAQKIDELFENSFAETLTETEKAFQMSFISMSEAILTAIELVSLVVIVIILAVVANTMSMSVRERLDEFAVLKTLGFGAATLGSLIFGESLVITSMGGLIGMALTFPAAAYFRDALGQYFPVFNVDVRTLYQDLAAVTVVGTVAAGFPIWQAVRVPIAEGLRRIG